MSLTIASDKTQRFYRWSDWKVMYVTKGLPLQWDDDGTMYTIWTYDSQEVLMCQIYKTEVSESATSVYSQIQNDLDKTDFETNYKSLGNKPLSQIDTDGAQIVRIKAAKRGWSFWALPIELTTSTIGGNIYAKDSNGSNINGVSCKIYDSSNVEITTPGLLGVNLSQCTKTVLDFEPTFDYEMIGGVLSINSNPTQDVRLWIIGAPDIDAIYGGSKEFISGTNLKFLAPDSTFDVDGRVTKYVSYNATDHRGKLRILIRHPAGLEVNMQITLHTYRL
jgi:hypothetical protein